MSTRTALVVDDSRSARFALRRYLEHHAYKVETAESAEEAYSILQGCQPEVIFLDHVMPGTDGFTALQHLKKDPRTGAIPVIICSSNEGDAFSAEARAKGAVDVLQKPPSPEQLTRVLENLTSLSAQLRSQANERPAAERPREAAPAMLAVPPPKVANLRQPDVTLGQAVMTALRSSLSPDEVEVLEATLTGSAAAAAARLMSSLNTTPPAPARSTPAPAATLPPASPPRNTQLPAPPPPPAAARPMHPSASAPPAASRPAPAAAPARPDLLELRLRKLTQDFFSQVGELRATVSLLESKIPEPNEAQEQQIARDHQALMELQLRYGEWEGRLDLALPELQGRIAALEARVQSELAELQLRFDRLEQQLDARMVALQQQFDETLETHVSARLAPLEAQLQALLQEPHGEVLKTQLTAELQTELQQQVEPLHAQLQSLLAEPHGEGLRGEILEQLRHELSERLAPVAMQLDTLLAEPHGERLLTQVQEATQAALAQRLEPVEMQVQSLIEEPHGNALHRQILDELQARLSERLAPVETQLQGLLDEPHGAALQQQMEAQLAEVLEPMQEQLRTLLDEPRGSVLEHRFVTQLQSQEARIDQVAAEARALAIEEAHAASERTVMSAAARIADQLAESILRGLGRQ